MTAPFPLEYVPQWCVPELRAVQEAWEALHRRRAMTPRDRGVHAVLSWVGLGDVASLSWVAGSTVADVRAESWLALCLAAAAPAPSERDWQRLGVAARTVHPEVAPAAQDLEFPYGVWTTTAWLLGVREDWPISTSWHVASGIPDPWPHLLVPAGRRDSAWCVADGAAREQAQAEAWRWWAHVRQRADATDTAQEPVGLPGQHS